MKHTHTPVSVAIGLPACPDCHALRGDPCRTPSNRTRFPHDGRLRVAKIDGVRTWLDSDDTGENITDEQIRELRDQEANWLDEHPPGGIGASVHYDDWVSHDRAFKSARIALGELTPNTVMRGWTRAEARARCAEILNARGGK